MNEAMGRASGELAARLAAVSVENETIDRLVRERPMISGDFEQDRETFARFWTISSEIEERLVAGRSAARTQAALEALRQESRSLRKTFLDVHAEALYRRITKDLQRSARIEELVEETAALVPGLVPDEAALDAEANRPLAEKHGIERDHGLLLGAILNEPVIGHHLCTSMLLPRDDSHELLPRLMRDGKVDLGRTTVERRGKASIVTLCHPRTRNAEDESTLAPFEAAVDLALLDPDTEICVLRGGPVEGASYPAGRVFSSGINLTDLYRGKVSYLFYLIRDLGLTNKMYRGLLSGRTGRPGQEPETREKLWVGVLESFAIGGGCQLALVMDYVIAEDTAYMTLPARKEGIIPGLANLRLPQFVGRKLARQAILYERRIDCDSPGGRQICDDVVSVGDIDQALDRAIEGLTNSGVVSAAGNRKAMRVNLEPLDAFRRYMAVYAPEQAECHLSPALVRNLEEYWRARERRP